MTRAGGRRPVTCDAAVCVDAYIWGMGMGLEKACLKVHIIGVRWGFIPRWSHGWLVGCRLGRRYVVTKRSVNKIPPRSVKRDQLFFIIHYLLQ